MEDFWECYVKLKKVVRWDFKQAVQNYKSHGAPYWDFKQAVQNYKSHGAPCWEL